jgi:hypothetical protein
MRGLLGVKSSPDGPEVRLPLRPRKRTQLIHRATSVQCQKRKSVWFQLEIAGASSALATARVSKSIGQGYCREGKINNKELQL